MSPIMFLVLLAVPFLGCASQDIDNDTLLNVFGQAQAYRPAGSFAAESTVQAAVVTPEKNTLVDPDYWDLDVFQPSEADYDRFDWTITKRVSDNSDENFLMSPLGLKLALAILTEAATGPTQEELSSVLGFDLDRTAVRRKFASIIESLKKESPEYVFNLGSRIYIGSRAQPRQRFAAIAEEFYKTELKSVDFASPVGVSNEINAWVSNITKGRIPNLVKEDDVAGLVVLILNALYFKGTWRHQFAPNETKADTFYVTPTLKKSVPFMHIKEKFYYTESTKYDAKILRLPYRGKKFSMFIIVPNSLTGLSHVFNGLSELRVEASNLQEREVEVTLPKFKFEYTSRLDGVIRDMGVRQAFEDTASFPGIARGQLLYEKLRVSKIVQNTGIEVNEIGSVAFAATEIGIVNKFGEDSDGSYEVIANKPFLFFIQDEVTKQLLFTGRVSDPTLLNGAFKQ